MNSGFVSNLRIGYGISVLLLIISGTASIISIRNLVESSQWVSHTHEVLQHLEDESSILKDAETGQRGFLLTGDRQFLKPYEGAAEKATAELQTIKFLISDNNTQQVNVDSLRILVNTRFLLLQDLINKKNTGIAATNIELLEGNVYMDKIRDQLLLMKNEENRLLALRTTALGKIISYVPFVIILASLLGLIIAIYSYRRVIADFNVRSKLQNDLIEKDKGISNRIEIIQKIAGSISGGDYKIRVNDDQKDDLGILSGSLNKMAVSLDDSFQALAAKEWMQTGIAGLNQQMLGEKETKSLCDSIISYIAGYTNSQVGGLYLAENNSLYLEGLYALKKTSANSCFAWGEGIIGQCAASGEPIITSAISGSMEVSFASAVLLPESIIVFPVFHENKIKAVLELVTVTAFAGQTTAYLNDVSHSIGIAIESAQSRQRIQALLEEVQAQTEELQAQHSELENNNTELEAQSHKLQASEEELRVQQEELTEANQELEERSRLLEEKNRLIADKNVEIGKKADELEISTRYKSEFLANMSHELRTPLNSILLLSRLLSDNTEKNLSGEQVESAQVIQSSGKGLLMLIDEILDLSKIESGKMELDYGVVTLEQVAGHMRQLFGPLAKEKNIGFNIEIDPSLPTGIYSDEQRLEQILKNLLSNAMKFTETGSVTFGVRPSASPSHIDFFVKDTGIGIAPEKQQLIFEAFQQADGTTRRKFGGTGLGLSISRELAKLLGGSIYLSSAVNHGSEFYLSLPVSPGQPAVPVIAHTNRIAAAAAAVPEHPAKKFIADGFPEDVPDNRENIMPGDKLILIVEDDTHFAKILLRQANDAGYKGIISVRGDRVAQLALQYQPAAILLDIILPVKSGWEVLEELKANPGLRHIPVHMMSSMEAKKESLHRGAVDFINKPFATEQMKQVFAKLEAVINRAPGKVLIIEENPQHAKALAYFLEQYQIKQEIRSSVDEGILALRQDSIQCVILDMGIPDRNGYKTLEQVKNDAELENLPIIVFTGKSLSAPEEARIRKYADSIVVKTAHSYQRILDEVGLFLHLVGTGGKNNGAPGTAGLDKMGSMDEILKDKTVLIADDDVRNIFSLTRALEKHKMKIVSAIDGLEALQVLKNPQQKVDIVLMDIMMPGMDGYETIRQIRQEPGFKKLPVLAITSRAMLGEREKCIKAGASDYISKPVDLDQLTSLLRVWLYDKSN
jgi:signal transduction histidine kinase/DNA-binding response OmpR family regulator/CHASE3 domain sensor protein